MTRSASEGAFDTDAFNRGVEMYRALTRQHGFSAALSHYVGEPVLVVGEGAEMTKSAEPPVELASQDELRFGVREYTRAQADVIDIAVRQIPPLRAAPLPEEVGREAGASLRRVADELEREASS